MSSQTDAPICPRCGHHIPNDETPGAYIGARSRTPGDPIEICSACGNMEALEQMEGRLTPREQWPVEVPDGLRLVNTQAYWENVAETIDAAKRSTDA